MITTSKLWLVEVDVESVDSVANVIINHHIPPEHPYKHTVRVAALQEWKQGDNFGRKPVKSAKYNDRVLQLGKRSELLHADAGVINKIVNPRRQAAQVNAQALAAGEPKCEPGDREVWYASQQRCKCPAANGTARRTSRHKTDVLKFLGSKVLIVSSSSRWHVACGQAL
jgi:hypothetical protein